MSNANISDKNKTVSSLDRKIEIIKSELEIIRPETLILNVDPNLDSKELIDEIQNYYNLIYKEMIKLVKLNMNIIRKI